MLNITLTKNQWERLSEISGNAGLLVSGSVIIPFFLDRSDLLGAIKGVVIALFLWYISLETARKY